MKTGAVGVIRFVGPLDDSEGKIFYGVDLFEGSCTCDGTYKGKRYFDASVNKGVFAKKHELRKKVEGWELLQKVVKLNNKMNLMKRKWDLSSSSPSSGSHTVSPSNGRLLRGESLRSFMGGRTPLGHHTPMGTRTPAGYLSPRLQSRRGSGFDEKQTRNLTGLLEKLEDINISQQPD